MLLHYPILDWKTRLSDANRIDTIASGNMSILLASGSGTFKAHSLLFHTNILTSLVGVIGTVC